MELKQLLYFKCVAEYEHMTKAALRLGGPALFEQDHCRPGG